MHDIVISGATIVDGTGAPAFTGDVAVTAGVITQVGGSADGAAKRRITADGMTLTPGWVDVHTHYDGQVTWDEDLEPSATNGVTTLVMGNCGVGFAPVRPGQEAPLIELMEGVEDIPGSALAEGIPWGAWETFPQYLDYLATRRYSIDIGTQVAHGALRFYAMVSTTSMRHPTKLPTWRASSVKQWTQALSVSRPHERSVTARCRAARFPEPSRPMVN